jgi:cystathionine beta-lyase/cystathionine gamma-synthase
MFEGAQSRTCHLGTHVGHKPASEFGVLMPLVFMRSAYAFEKVEAREQIFRGERVEYLYGRRVSPV